MRLPFCHCIAAFFPPRTKAAKPYQTKGFQSTSYNLQSIVARFESGDGKTRIEPNRAEPGVALAWLLPSGQRLGLYLEVKPSWLGETFGG